MQSVRVSTLSKLNSFVQESGTSTTNNTLSMLLIIVRRFEIAMTYSRLEQFGDHECRVCSALELDFSNNDVAFV